MFLFVAVELGKYLAAQMLVTIVHIEVNGGEHYNLYCRINPRLANENADEECDAAPVEVRKLAYFISGRLPWRKSLRRLSGNGRDIWHVLQP